MKSKNKPEIDPESYMEMLVDLKIPHTVKSCSSSTSIKIENGKSYFFPNGEKIESKYLSFIKDVKKEVCFNADGKNFKEVNPKFIRFSPIFSGDFFHEDFTEIDIVGAYWFTAFDFDLISRQTYEQGLAVPKRVRLMALGSAAAVKDVMFFDGERYQNKGIEYDNAGRLAFFNVAKQVDNIMNDALDALHGQAAFYWVDALFVRDCFVDQAAAIIEGRGYATKKTKLAWFKGDSDRKTISAMQIISMDENICEFERKTYFKPQKRNRKAKKK